MMRHKIVSCKSRSVCAEEEVVRPLKEQHGSGALNKAIVTRQRFTTVAYSVWLRRAALCQTPWQVKHF